jgi:hypothetical protein
MAQPKWLGLARPLFKKKFKNHFLKKIVIFSNIFLFILCNIRLYIYTVKYKSGIKIPGFLQKFSKQISKHFQKEKKIFCCIRLNPKIFSSIFFIKKTKIASLSRFKMQNEYHNQFMIIH